jgi:hypothetical protein
MWKGLTKVLVWENVSESSVDVSVCARAAVSVRSGMTRTTTYPRWLALEAEVVERGWRGYR